MASKRAQYLVVYDTEFTAWPGSMQRSWSAPGEYREIFQIAAIKLEYDAGALKPVGSFSSIIKPKINPQLSSYVINLTGITQNIIEELGIDFESSFQQFLAFYDEGIDSQVLGVSWGADDVVLLENCDLCGIEADNKIPMTINLRQFAKQKVLPGCNMVSGELASANGIALDGHVHNALHDVKSISEALIHWTSKGYFNCDELFLSANS